MDSFQETVVQVIITILESCTPWQNQQNPTDPEWRTGSFNQGIVLQKQRDANDNLVEAINLEGANNSWRAGQTTTSDTWSGKMIGLLMTDVNDSTKNAIPRSFNVNNLTVTFDDRNDRVKFVGTRY